MTCLWIELFSLTNTALGWLNEELGNDDVGKKDVDENKILKKVEIRRGDTDSANRNKKIY